MTPAEVDAMDPDELRAFAEYMTADLKAQQRAAKRR